jgi:hypothetical protein
MSGILIEFILFMVVQSLFINGVHECFTGRCWQDVKDGYKCAGNVFYKINPKWFESAKGKWWADPLFNCVKCMSSLYGSLTFWPVVIYVYGFRWEEIFVWLIDIASLVYLNFFFYKKQ